MWQGVDTAGQGTRLTLDWEALRAEFPVVDEYTCLNHAAVSPLPACVVKSMEEHLQRCQSPPTYHAEYMAAFNRTRNAVAALINATPDEIAFVQNTGTGISLIANGLPLQTGDEVILVDMEYPANVYPWMNLTQKGVRLRIVPHRGGGLDLGMLQAEVHERTRVITVSSVEFLSGYRTDLAALGAFCHQQGIFFVVDAIQSLGVIPLDVRACHVDCLAAGAWKWLLGPQGQAFLFCRQELLSQVQPILTGAEGVVNESDYLTYDMRFVPGADRFHNGMLSGANIAGLGTAVEMLLKQGVDNIERRVLELTGLLIDGLQKRGYPIFSNLEPAHRSGIVTFGAEDVGALYARLCAARVVVSCRWDAQGTKYIRVSPHAYSNEQDIAHLLRVLDGEDH